MRIRMAGGLHGECGRRDQRRRGRRGDEVFYDVFHDTQPRKPEMGIAGVGDGVWEGEGDGEEGEGDGLGEGEALGVSERVPGRGAPDLGVR